MSEQFLVTECFFNLFLEEIRTIIIQIRKKILGFRNIQEKLDNDLKWSILDQNAIKHPVFLFLNPK